MNSGFLSAAFNFNVIRSSVHRVIVIRVGNGIFFRIIPYRRNGKKGKIFFYI